MRAFITANISSAGKSISLEELAADWFPCAGGGLDSAFVRRGHEGKSILVTGAGGWIGSALARILYQAAPRRLVLLDHAEHDLFQIYRDLTQLVPAHKTEIIPILGDICDERLLQSLLRHCQPSFIYHLAAAKHVSLAESNPVAVVCNNAIGTYKLAVAAQAHGTARLIMVSTDKAANPRGLMGASKRVAELVLLSLSGSTEMKAVRFGNIFGSRGSVVPIFLQQISCGGPVTVTHPDVTRYILSLCQGIHLILRAAVTGRMENIFVPEFGRQINILQLAECLIRRAGYLPHQEIQIQFTGLQPGEKISEDLIAGNEFTSTERDNGLLGVHSPGMPAPDLHRAIARMEKTAKQFDLVALLDMLSELVPGYKPSETLLASSAVQYCGPEVL